MTELNWDDLVDDAAEATKPIPEGNYTLKVEKAVWKPSKAGNQMMSINYSIVGGPQDGKSCRYWITHGSRDFQVVQFVSAFKAHGVSSPDFSVEPEILEAQFLGKQVKGDLKHDGEWNGQPSIKVTNITGTGNELKPPPAVEAADALPAAEELAPPPMPEV